MGKKASRSTSMTSSNLRTSIDSLQYFYREIQRWARSNLRQFPWRETRDPYRVFLAECLLKRTTSVAAYRVYIPLLDKYPNIFSLASAQNIEDDLRPIGLYRQRGKLILQAARYVANDLKGSFPRDLRELTKIPGIGEYGASAIASFAFQVDVATVDSNVLRILRRFLGENQLDIKGSSLFLEGFLKNKASRNFNFAMIDLGSMVCRPLNPKCDECPLSRLCEYRKVVARQDEV